MAPRLTVSTTNTKLVKKESEIKQIIVSIVLFIFRQIAITIFGSIITQSGQCTVNKKKNEDEIIKINKKIFY